MAQSPQSMEPADGDYVRYVEQLHAGKIKELNAMRVSVVDTAEDGMLKVSSPKELIQREEAARQARETRKNDFTGQIVRMTGPLVLILSIVLLVVGGTSGMDDLIPVGMFTLFAGIVMTNEARKRR